MEVTRNNWKYVENWYGSPTVRVKMDLDAKGSNNVGRSLILEVVRFHPLALCLKLELVCGRANNWNGENWFYGSPPGFLFFPPAGSSRLRSMAIREDWLVPENASARRRVKELSQQILGEAGAEGGLVFQRARPRSEKRADFGLRFRGIGGTKRGLSA